MSLKTDKVIYLSRNNEEVRSYLRARGYRFCVCAEFEQNIWLSYTNISKDIHGVGVGHGVDSGISPLELVKQDIINNVNISRKCIICNTAEDFANEIEKYKTNLE